jgi:tRNA-specific 2-thiouridylase
MKKKVVLLFSGGLDSVIAALILKEQVDVVALFIENGFRKESSEKYEYLTKITDRIGIPLIIKHEERNFFEMWKNPKFGYGKGMNPCVNCHANMLNVALDYMKGVGFDFIATGEVAEQRGFSQTFNQQKKVDSLVSDTKLILRPLSAKKWEETEMEKLGWVDREKLLSIVGKSRKIQYEILEKYGIKKEEVEVPAGGCMMAEKNMKKKMKGINIEELSFEDFQLMKTGRHLDILKKRLVLTRNKEEMLLLDGLVSNAKIIKTNQLKSPVGYFFGEINDNVKEEIKKIMLKYSKVEDGEFSISIK